MKFSTLNFENNPNIGLFAFATDKFCIARRFIRGKDARLIQNVLKVPVFEASALKTGFMGIFAAGNSRGAVISDKIYDEEIEQMRKHVPVLVLETKHTAMGNLMVANDNGCLISRELEPYAREIGEFLGVEARAGTIAGMDLVGSLAVCNSRGCLVHKSVTEKEKRLIEKILGVPALPGSVNFGNQWIRSGLVANSNGFVAGDRTSGPELGLAAEALGFV